MIWKDKVCEPQTVEENISKLPENLVSTIKGKGWPEEVLVKLDADLADDAFRLRFTEKDLDNWKVWCDLILEESNLIKNSPLWAETKYGPRPGLPKTPQTIASGTVKMELHTEYNSMLQEFKNQGYNVEFIKEDFTSVKLGAEVEIKMVTDQQGAFLKYEKKIILIEGMDYNTLLHEYGHIQQVEKALLEGKVLGPKGYLANSGGFKEVVKFETLEYNFIEYHNRLKDLERLSSLKKNGVYVPDEVIKQAKAGANYYKSLAVVDTRYSTTRLDKLKERLGKLFEEIKGLESYLNE